MAAVRYRSDLPLVAAARVVPPLRSRAASACPSGVSRYTFGRIFSIRPRAIGFCGFLPMISIITRLWSGYVWS